MTKTIDGRKYLMRNQRATVRQLREWHKLYCAKCQHNPPTMHQWLVERGMVYKEIR